MNEEEIKVIEHINKTFTNASLKEINNALVLIQRKIIDLKNSSRMLIKEHFTKFVECNFTLQEIQKDLKYKPDINEYLKKEYEILKEKSKEFKKEKIISDEKFNILEVKRHLQANYNNFGEFVKIFTNIKNKKDFLEEKKIFSEFLLKKIDLEKDTDEIIKFFKYFFIINDTEVNSVMIDNTILVSFKEQINSVNLFKLEFKSFFDKIQHILSSFIKLIKKEDLKFECVNFLFKKIEEEIKKIHLKREVKIYKKECYCFSIEKNCLCEENNLKFIRGMDSKTLLISIKVFHRRILEIKEMLKTQINTNSQRFISLKIEEFMRIFFDLTLSFLSYNEDIKIFKEIKMIFTEQEILSLSIKKYLKEYFDLRFECLILKYEFIRKNIFKLERKKESSHFIKMLLQLIGITKVIELLNELLKDVALQSKMCLGNVKKDESSLLIFINRTVLLAPFSFAEILRNSESVFVTNKIVSYFLQRILNIKIVLNEEERKFMMKFNSVYGYLLK
ncbi:hypothetical protein TUBRATIS_17220 [Tubulinosema ratisbonensis]|uniref:Uncharacterized protein n=1 Tax=Tubulinosema ratisbonensis TaxID=291195 RepID=A0A437AL69_9MICR|nr:hypothetical protein TUBRATIS_17220 [Tubulinosema ratisbonensis]